jgi:hypothetical protein
VIDIATIKARFKAFEPVLDERERRLFTAGEARAAGHGGVVAVSWATGLPAAQSIAAWQTCVQAW